MKNSVILPCSGTGSRMGLGYNKLKYDIGGMPLIQKTISAFLRKDIYSIVISCNKDDFEWFTKLTQSLNANITICLGGDTRQNSIYNALQVLDKDTDFVIIHDGARPFVSQNIIDNALNSAYKNGNAVACINSIDSLRVINNNSSNPIDRSSCKCVQTPQIFKYDSILRAYECAHKDNIQFSDDASLYQKYIGKIFITDGSPENVKITTQNDLHFFYPNNAFVGIGWDTHQLVENRDLILGGIKIPHNKGLLGHSDADVLTHAIMDALLSATHNKDIGNLFPDTDNKYKNISSLILLKEVVKIITKQGYRISNISAVIMAQKPKCASFIADIQKSLASTIQINETQITISATTTEKLGLIGHEEAISANAYCLVIKEV